MEVDARQTVQPHARLRLALPLGARAAPHASRRARAKQFSRMPGTTTSDKSWKTRSRSANEMADLQRADRTGACFPTASARAAQRPRPSVRKRESPAARRRRRAALTPRVFRRSRVRARRPRRRAPLSSRYDWPRARAAAACADPKPGRPKTTRGARSKSSRSPTRRSPG